MLEYLIPLLIFAAGFYAIYRWAPATRKRLFYFILGAVVLLWFLSAIGLFGTTDPNAVPRPAIP